MKNKKWMYALTLPVMLFLISHNVTAQDSTARHENYNARVDSVAKVYKQREIAKDKSRKDSQNLTDLKADRKETSDNATEAQRVANDANNAARQSKMAYRQEKKAQKARAKADKQTKKATKARTISDQN